MSSSASLEIVNGATKVTLQDNTSYILVINQALFDPNPEQQESLLQPHQARAHGVAIDDCAKRHRALDGSAGKQAISIAGTTIPLYYDGWKCFLETSTPTNDELQNLPWLELTSPLPYEPSQRIHTRRRRKSRKYDDDQLEKWRAILGYPPLDVVKATLKASTQMVTTVETETREYMRDHFKARLYPLRPHRINDICFSDTFFSSIRSIRGFTMFQLFAFKHSQMDVPYLMRRKSQCTSRFLDLIREVGAPNAMVTDNAREMTGEAWINVCRQFCIESHSTEAYHPNQNLAERRGGDLKTAVIKLFHHIPHAPLSFWCYALEYMALVRSCLARPLLDSRSPQEILYGETVDISRFRFPWFSPVWFYDPVSFPHDKMKPGFMLGIAPTVGDAFSYIILTDQDYQRHLRQPTRSPDTLIRSVVRARQKDNSSAPIVTKNGNSLQFTFEDGTPLESTSSTASINIESIQPDDDELSSSELSVSSALDSIIFEHEVPFDVDEDVPDSIDTIPRMITTDTSPQPVSEEHLESVTTTPPEPVENVNNSHSIQSPSDHHPSHVPMVSQTQDDDSVSDSSVDSSPILEKVADSVNEHFMGDSSPEADEIIAITSHRWVDGMLELEVEYYTGGRSFMLFELLQNDDPEGTAQYILNADLGRYPAGQRYKRWARHFLRSVRRFVRRMCISGEQDLPMSTFTSAKRTVRSTNHKRKNPGRNNRRPLTAVQSKYGIKIPTSYNMAVEFDLENGNTKWQEAVRKEVAALIFHKCFDFKPPDYKVPDGYQRAPMKMVYEVKNDLRQKARFVVQGHRVDPGHLNTRSTVVKGISVRLLDIIAHRDNLTMLAGDIGNAFIQAYTKEKCYTICGPEFGDKEFSIAIVVRALYGLTTSAERWRSLFADFLRSLGFSSARFDRDVWLRMRDDNSGYDFICTHVDDFKIVAKDPQFWMDKVKDRFLVKTSGPPDYYLGSDYRFEDKENLYTIGSTTYSKECIRKVEEVFGCLRKYNTPAPSSDNHPEMDDSPLLDSEGQRRYQSLLGMGTWLVTIGRPDLCHSVSSMSRFGACPRQNHLTLMKQIFGYLKKFPDKRIKVDSTDIDFSSYTVAETMSFEFLKDYPYAKEDLDPGFPEPRGRPLQTTIFCDSDHAHDLKTRRSLTGVLGFVGSTPVLWFSRRQTLIASSTYAAEFMAMRTAAEEAISLRYMLRCLGVPIASDGSAPTRIFGDNFSVVTNAADPHADLKKKHVAISFHFVRECIAAGIIAPFWIDGKHNLSDIMTKQLCAPEYLPHVETIFWSPPHRA